MLVRISQMCVRRRRVVVAVWIAAVVLLSVVAAAFGGAPRNDFSLPGSESQASADLLREGGFGGRGGLTGQMVIAAADVTDDEVMVAVDGLLAAVARDVEGLVVRSPFEPDAHGQISADRTVAFAGLEFGDVDVDDAGTMAAEARAIGDSYADLPAGVQLEYGGQMFWEEPEFSSQAIGLAAAVVILLGAFGSVLAMGLPISTALVGIGCGVAVVGLVANAIDVPAFAPAAVAMIGIGVGIDYALMLVVRYREELAAGHEPSVAVDRAMATAGRAVFFAGTTVVMSMVGLAVIGVPATRSLAVAIIAGVVFVMAASLTLLPALLGFAGRSIDRLRVRRRPMGAASHGTFWPRWSAAVQRRPATVAVIGLALLGVLAAPTLSMRLGFGDAGNQPDSDTARRAHDLIADGFGPGANGPLFVAVDAAGEAAVDAPGDPAAASMLLDDLVRDLDQQPGTAAVFEPVVGDRGIAVIQVLPATGPQDDATAELVQRLRGDVAAPLADDRGARILIGGSTAAVVDFADDQAVRLPWFIAAVLAVAYVLLAFVYRSLLVPLKAVVMNLLSIGAAYGVVVAVFQWGWGAELLGIGEPGPIDAWVPMMMFAIVFGLSMDYEVFLLSRIREHYDVHRDNAAAVSDGLTRTARLITAAALIMVVVFGAFVLSADRSLQLFGFGLAVAVFLDATLVRLLLVPATMELLGDRNWWLPAPLARRTRQGRAAPVPSRTTSGITHRRTER